MLVDEIVDPYNIIQQVSEKLSYNKQTNSQKNIEFQNWLEHEASSIITRTTKHS